MDSLHSEVFWSSNAYTPAVHNSDMYIFIPHVYLLMVDQAWHCYKVNLTCSGEVQYY